MNDAILSLNITNAPLIVTMSALSIALVLYLLIRRPTTRWVLTAALALVGGALAGALTILITVNVLDLFGTRLSPVVDVWIILTFTGVAVAIANLWLSSWWRKLIAVIGIVVIGLTGTLGVNAAFGLNKTVAAFFGVTNEKPLDIGSNTNSPTADPNIDPNAPLYSTWKAPADMPATGSLGTVSIPNTESGFLARTPLAYVPPAGLVDNKPKLPVIIQLNGQPGSPGLDDPKVILDKLAAEHNGLGPIVVNPDQLGDDSKDPLCLDTSMGNVETYIMKDVVPWVKSHFAVSDNPKDWTILGFSNGGMCASYFGAKYPQVFGNFVDLSGDEYQGVDDRSTLSRVFQGDQAAYEAVWPTTIMSKTTYPDSVGVFTVGESDTEATAGVKKNYDAAVAAGIMASFTVIPGGGHDNVALDGGLSTAYDVLFPRWGLIAPTT
ncbi:alpha/beta hydrolase [Subtercola boreus]|uniref:Esterase n=1 Tax=Subtercola boreus TaxID=120213 RepID=A0A3E0WCM3_9MICO|nr:alpha/beta hydrolase-fold protein [Subtercola boreus]RFA22544.1 hypothetical protein B7R24_02655 [Subtercola boreus]RFA22900.1 hypothetical protein B7R23_02650 [Subtercola boreus]RFA28652.1 hypothetical protein B7R25_02665 [Subtercola boreus]